MAGNTKNARVIYLTGPEAAAFCGVSYRQFMNWLDGEYPPPRTEKKTFPSDMLGQWVRDKVKREIMAKASRDPDAEGAQSQLARKNKLQADKLEMENAKARGDLVDRSSVVEGWQKTLMLMKAKVMAIPSSAAAILVGTKDKIEIQETLDDLCREALGELSEYDPRD